jgi:hypothetical protein
MIMFVTCQQQTLIILSLVLNKLKEMGLDYFHLHTFENIVQEKLPLKHGSYNPLFKKFY